MAALESGGVDPVEASSSPEQALTGLDSFDVAATPKGENWDEGEQLSYRDVVAGQGGPPYRYVAWGQQIDGTQYLLTVRLGTEIL